MWVELTRKAVLGLIYFFFFLINIRQNPLPGPIPLPIVGNVLQYTGDAGKFMEGLRLIYGDMFEIYLGTKRVVCLCRSEMAGKLFNSPLRTYSNDGLDEFGVSSKGVLLNSNYDSWSYHRRILQKTISSPQFTKETVESTQALFREMEGLWKRIDNIDGDVKKIDFAGWLSQFTFENTLFSLTTLRAHNLINYYNATNPQNKVVVPEGTIPNSHSFIESLKMIFEGAHFFLLTPKLLRNSPGISGTRDRLLKNKAWMSNILLKLISERRTQVENSNEKIDSNDLLTRFLTVNTDKDINKNIADDKHTEKISDDDIKATIADLLLGGTFTTAGMLSAIVYYLGHNPKEQKRMVQELDDVLGSDRDSNITLDQVNKLEYTDAVFKEASRLFPNIPVNIRANAEPSEIAGHRFPAKTQFMIDIEAIHRSPDYWNDPDTFNPDRWTNNPDPKQFNNYYQFGGGVRVCPGRKMALAEVKTIVALLYRNYDIELVDKVSPLNYKYDFIKIVQEFEIKIKPRN
ncbi:cytochrome P450 [Rhizophagus clarus]|uniref:Cytochrome P450 n=1 Tax=Rhizophagus clarus TaxID=94130 RepID=A0A8H3KNB8_9GLOM|nr:cytochrome P450 [Rhizophagus clarus]